MKENEIRLQIGQVYVEDLGPGFPPNRLEIISFGERLVSYFKSSRSARYSMLRNRFEACIRGGAFILQSKPLANVRFDKATALQENALLRTQLEGARLTISRLEIQLNQIREALKL